MRRTSQSLTAVRRALGTVRDSLRKVERGNWVATHPAPTYEPDPDRYEMLRALDECVRLLERWQR